MPLARSCAPLPQLYAREARKAKKKPLTKLERVSDRPRSAPHAAAPSDAIQGESEGERRLQAANLSRASLFYLLLMLLLLLKLPRRAPLPNAHTRRARTPATDPATRSAVHAFVESVLRPIYKEGRLNKHDFK